MKYMEREEIFCCPKTSRAYPDRLRCFDDMPEYLYVKGKLPDSRKKSVAIVGARRCSSYGSSQAYYFAKELSRFGIQIISGMARGVDGWHTGEHWTAEERLLRSWVVARISVIPGRT